jgi:hypothetical protein
LRLPERLTEASSRYYSVGELSSLGRAAAGEEARLGIRLRGVFCASVGDGVAAADAGADFLVMRDALDDGEVVRLCGLVSGPVFVHGIDAARAWELGASGVNEIND